MTTSTADTKGHPSVFRTLHWVLCYTMVVLVLVYAPLHVTSVSGENLELGLGCFSRCGYKSGTCPHACPTTSRMSGSVIVYTSYKCCRRGWHPLGGCNVGEGCVGRHCCVEAGESLEDPGPHLVNAATADTVSPDPACISGIVSEDGVVCSPISCIQSDGAPECILRQGAEACCSNLVLHTAVSCTVSAPPCVIDESQRSKRLASCVDKDYDKTFELSSRVLQLYEEASPSEKADLGFALESGAVIVRSSNIGRSYLLDLTSDTATVLLKASYQPSTNNRNKGFSLCMWFKPSTQMAQSQLSHFPLASKFIEDSGWELRMTLNGRISFHVATELGSQFYAVVKIPSSEVFQWHHVCGIYYGGILSKAGILVDGSLFSDHFLPSSTASYKSVTSVRDTRVARSLGDPRYKFRGLVADFKIWEETAIAIHDMQHIAAACGGGPSATKNVAIGSPVNLYFNKEANGHLLTDTSKCESYVF